MLTDNWHVTFGQGHQMTLTSRIPCRLNFDALLYRRAQQQPKYALFQRFPFKSLRDQIWTCHKIGQGQPRVIIYINFEGLNPQMGHTKFQGNWPSSSWEEAFFKNFTIYGHGGHLGHVTWTKYIIFLSPFAWRLHMKFKSNWPSSFREEVLWKCWWQADGQRLSSYKLPWSIWLREANDIMTLTSCSHKSSCTH